MIRSPLTSRRQSRRGAMLITTVLFIGVISVLLAGVGSYAASHQMQARSDADFARALDIAEAGANTEFQKLTLDSSKTDHEPTTYSFAEGSCTVWVTQRESDGSEVTPWTPPNDLYVYSRGTVNGISRTVKVAVRACDSEANYAIFGITTVSMLGNVQITGDVGSNGVVTQGHSVNVSGSIYLNGPHSAYVGMGTTTRRTNPTAVTWPTVNEIADEKFPQGGLAWLASHNDNARANPPIVGNRITGSVTLGPGNYYITGINLSGNRQIRFNNTNGSINVWLGPSGGPGVMQLRGTTDATTVVADGGHQVNIYAATWGALDMSGNSTLRANVYAYNRDGLGLPYGAVTNSGNPGVTGNIIANDVALVGAAGVVFVKGTDVPKTVGYYGYDNSWEEGAVNGEGVWQSSIR